MQRLLPVGSQGFPELLTRLGIQPPLVAPFWLLSNVIQPVSIVDQNLNVDAIVQPFVFETVAAGGETVNPAANTVIADTGPQLPGTFQIYVSWAFEFTTPNAPLWLARKDAANVADIWASVLAYSTGNVGSQGIYEGTFRLENSERIVVRTSHLGALTGRCQSTIAFRQVS